MVDLTFSSHLRRHVDCPAASVEATTVRGAFEAYLLAHPQVRSYVLDDQHRPRKHVVVFVNDSQVVDRDGLSDAVADGDTIHILQALSGG